MKSAKKKKLVAAGFRVGDAEEFLELTDAERELVELRVRVSRAVRARRESAQLTQQELANRMQSNQSRVAKLESGAKGVSLELMLRGLLAAGGSLNDLFEPATSGGLVKKNAAQGKRTVNLETQTPIGVRRKKVGTTTIG